MDTFATVGPLGRTGTGGSGGGGGAGCSSAHATASNTTTTAAAVRTMLRAGGTRMGPGTGRDLAQSAGTFVAIYN